LVLSVKAFRDAVQLQDAGGARYTREVRPTARRGHLRIRDLPAMKTNSPDDAD